MFVFYFERKSIFNEMAVILLGSNDLTTSVLIHFNQFRAVIVSPFAMHYSLVSDKFPKISRGTSTNIELSTLRCFGILCFNMFFVNHFFKHVDKL